MMESGVIGYEPSTHDLTKRSTCTSTGWGYRVIPSTHDLTKRSTSVFLPTTVIASLQLTTSRRGRRQICAVDVFHSSLQLTTSRRGRRDPRIHRLHRLPFNSRPHEEVDIGWTTIHIIQLTLQLTTSRRGRQVLPDMTELEREPSTHDLTKRSTNRREIVIDYICTFNSRPHEEVDLSRMFPAHGIRSFNSRPHEEVDSLCSYIVTLSGSLQLTTSRRGRHIMHNYPSPFYSLQLTTSRRGRLHHA